MMLGANRELRVLRYIPMGRDQYGDPAAAWTAGEWVKGNLGTRHMTQTTDGVIVTIRRTWARLPAGTQIGARDVIETRAGTRYRVVGATVRHTPWGTPAHVSVDLEQDGVQADG